MSPAARPPRRGATRGRTTAAASLPDAQPADEPVEATAAPNGRDALAAAIDAAVDAVASGWPYGEHSRLTREDVETTARRLAEMLHGDVEKLAPAAFDGLLPFVPARRVLEAFRSATLERAHATVDPAAVVRVARAFEVLQRLLDEHAAQRFASRLTGVEAQQLIVEMAHDMRSPLNSILILAERLQGGAGGAMSTVQQRQLGLIYSAAFGLSAIASDVIELARGGTTLVEQQPLPFSVADVLQSVLDILRPMAEEKRLTMTATGPRADFRLGHASALNRVLLNLTTNAIKFTSAGSVAVTCSELDRSRVEFSVQDTGRGIPRHVLDNLFEAFRQRQAPGDYAFSSAGLGLSICQLLVRAMGGELQVETELERGTRFYFTLDLPQSGRM
ncbi:MAG: HAMP domain-containing sensor histidine kinase [Gemmatimonadota bacterium]